MQLFKNIPMLRVTLLFITGLGIAASITDNILIAPQYLLWIVISQLIISVIVKFMPFQGSIYSSLIISFNLLIAGCCYFLHSKAVDRQDYFSEFLEKIEAYEAVVITEPNLKAFTAEAILSVTSVKARGLWKPAAGKVKIFIKDPVFTIEYGSLVIVNGSPQKIHPPLNPYEVNYKALMANKGIYHQHFVYGASLKVSEGFKGSYIKNLSIRLKKKFYNLIDENIDGQTYRAVLKSLTLGDKSNLNKHEIDNYIKTGTMHILAMSGLHVGILFSLIHLLIGRLYFFNKKTLVLYLVSMVFIWIYTFIAGFPESALRAAIMFSLFSIAKILNRDHYMVNSLVLSALLLLLAEPLMIKSCSFQLSYLAVTGIVAISPVIRPYLLTVFKRPLYLAEIINVSIAAQLAVLPAALYYFHNFSTYFLLANLIVIPLISIIAYLTFGMIIFSKVSVLSKFIGFLLGKLLHIMHNMLNYIKLLPYSSIDHVYLELHIVFLSYLILAIGLMLIYKRKFKKLVLLLTLVCFCFLAVRFRSFNQNIVVFYSIPKQAAFSLIKGRKSAIYLGNINHPKVEYSIMPFQYALSTKYSLNNLDDVASCSIYSVSEYRGYKIIDFANKKFIMLTDSCIVPELKLGTGNNSEKIEVAYLLLNSYKYDIVELCKIFNIKQIIIGTGLSRRKAITLEKQAKKLNVSTHSLSHKGALVLFF
jgi:competence protein ComEC